MSVVGGKNQRGCRFRKDRFCRLRERTSSDESSPRLNKDETIIEIESFGAQTPKHYPSHQTLSLTTSNLGRQNAF